VLRDLPQVRTLEGRVRLGFLADLAEETGGRGMVRRGAVPRAHLIERRAQKVVADREKRLQAGVLFLPDQLLELAPGALIVLRLHERLRERDRALRRQVLE